MTPFPPFLIFWAACVWIGAALHMVWCHRTTRLYLDDMKRIYEEHEVRREQIHRKLIADLRANYGLSPEPTDEERVH